MKLYPHQQEIVDKNPARHLLAHSTGTGKTITSISLAEKNCKSCIVIVPKVIKGKWEREIKEHSKICKYLILTKEEFKKQLLFLPKADGVIVDECHYFANRKSQLSKALRGYCKKNDVKYRWLCTATPYLSSPWNIYSIAEHLGHQWDYWKFNNEYFTMVQMGPRMVPIVKSNIEHKLKELVASIGSVVDMKEVVDEIPEQTFITEYFNRTIEQEDAIKNLEEMVFISRWTKVHQIENGLLYSEDEETKNFDTLKNEKIKEIAKSKDKLAIFCRYNSQIAYLAEYLKDDFTDILILNGQTKDKNQVIQQAQESQNCLLLIQSSCSVGYELTTFDTIVFASLSFSYTDYKQAIGRFLRINSLKQNTYYHLVTKGVDEDVYDSIMKKEDFNVAIYEKSLNQSKLY